MGLDLDVYLGKHNLAGIHGLVAEHWAIKIGDTWYEIQGDSKKENLSPNRILKHKDDSKYDTIEILGTIQETMSVIDSWNSAWLRKHPAYEFNGDNCQLYAKHFAWHFLGKNLDTQNTVIGGMMMGAGIGAIIVGIAAVVGGFLIRGRH
jgi:hypothetical protein